MLDSKPAGPPPVPGVQPVVGECHDQFAQDDLVFGVTTLDEQGADCAVDVVESEVTYPGDTKCMDCDDRPFTWRVWSSKPWRRSGSGRGPFTLRRTCKGPSVHRELSNNQSIRLGAWGAINGDPGRGVRTILAASGISVAAVGAAQVRLDRNIHCASQ